MGVLTRLLNNKRPRTGRLITERGGYVNEADAIALLNDSNSPFNELRTTNRTPVITLSSVYPISRLRDVTEGTVDQEIDEYRVDPSSALESAELIRYIPGYASEVGIGVRLREVEDAKWGAFDEDNGIYWRRANGSDLLVGVRRAGEDTEIERSDWNIDRLDGSGPSGIDLGECQAGIIWQITYTWYGYGPIAWSILDTRGGLLPRLWPVHVQGGFEDGTSVRNPNLPIRVENNSTNGQPVYVGGRQWSVVGDYVPNERVTCSSRTGVSVGTDWTPIIAVQRRQEDKFKPFSFTTFGVEPVWTHTSPLFLTIVASGELTGASFSWENACLRTEGETGLQFDVSATAIDTSSSDTVSPTIAVPGAPDPAGPVGPAAQQQDVSDRQRLPRDDVFTVVARTTQGTGNLDCVLLMAEEW